MAAGKIQNASRLLSAKYGLFSLIFRLSAISKIISKKFHSHITERQRILRRYEEVKCKSNVNSIFGGKNHD